MSNHVILYEVRRDVICDKCGKFGAVREYGIYYPYGKDGKEKGNPKMDAPIGFGGFIPWECLNCRNWGAIDNKEFEMNKKAFTSIEAYGKECRKLWKKHGDEFKDGHDIDIDDLIKFFKEQSENDRDDNKGKKGDYIDEHF